MTATGRCIPTRVEVATLEQPLSTLQTYLHVIVSMLCFHKLELVRRIEKVDVEIELRMGTGFYESCVTIFEQLAKPEVLRMQRNRHPPDPDGNRITQRKLRRMAHW
jgi:hypothetical protein